MYFKILENHFISHWKRLVHLFKKYKEINLLFPEYTDHPKETIVFFEKFCKDFNLQYKVLPIRRNMIFKKT